RPVAGRAGPGRAGCNSYPSSRLCRALLGRAPGAGSRPHINRVCVVSDIETFVPFTHRLGIKLSTWRRGLKDGYRPGDYASGPEGPSTNPTYSREKRGDPADIRYSSARAALAFKSPRWTIFSFWDGNENCIEKELLTMVPQPGKSGTDNF
ncbi:hypothetical protein chiPu_0020495, partial [Chiloscyllium punctatum]|nr:hypothetical protein [Chiloscyllium punctatum]